MFPVSEKQKNIFTTKLYNTDHFTSVNAIDLNNYNINDNSDNNIDSTVEFKFEINLTRKSHQTMLSYLADIPS